ncbi:MAG: hypothetical protein KAV87_60955 [Desulfobacteraceae bacterium]|nr:hypothetical protein [Desulfobacteraceae bacterium]
MDQTPSVLFKRTTKPVRQNQCFVLMPFRQEYDEIYQDILKPILQELGYHCLRADEIYGSTAIIHDIWDNIQIAGLIIADMTGKNPNVFYELGLGHAIGKNVILITQSLEDVPFDLRHLRCILYKHSLRGLIELRDKLKKTILQDRSYSKIPVDILTDNFLGGFTAQEIAFEMTFTGTRGEKTEVNEFYFITPEKDDFGTMYKKVQVDGAVSIAEVENSIVNIKKMFPGMYLLSILFSPPLHKNQQHQFNVKYRLENSFGSENEYWLYNAEVSIENFVAKFIFPSTYGVSNFKVYIKQEASEVLAVEQPKCESSLQDMIFTWTAHTLSPPDCFVFRWSWK